MKKYSHLFFDLDHTLWDFNTNSVSTLLEIYDHFSLQNKILVPSDKFIVAYQQINNHQWNLYRKGLVTKEELRSIRFTETFNHFNYYNVKLAEEIGHYYITHSPQKTSLLPNTIEILNYLKPKYKLHIITNGFEEVQHIKLEKSFLKPFFDQIITSEKAGAKKPSSIIFEHALSLINGTPDDAIMIGDSYEADILGAKSIGMDQVFFCERAEWKEGDATYNISNLIELKDIL